MKEPNYKPYKPSKNRYKTGEDIDMLRENEYERKNDTESNYENNYNTCDKSEDGA